MDIKNDYLDLIKVFSIILVSIYFISQIGYDCDKNHGLLLNIARLLSNLAFPLLLMVLGALTLNRFEGLYTGIKKIYYYMIPPFIVCCMILAIVNFYFNGVGSITYENILKYVWFIVVLLANILVIPILTEFIKSEKEDGIKYILLLFVFTGILWTLSVQFDFGLYYIDLVFFAEPFVFMVLGYYLANKEFNVSSSKLGLFSLIVFLTVVLMRILLVKYSIADWDDYFILLFKDLFLEISIDPFTLIEVSAIFLMFKSINRKLLLKSRLINFYSKVSYYYLLILSVFCLVLSNINLHLSWIKLTILGSIFIFVFSGIILFILSKFFPITGAK